MLSRVVPRLQFADVERLTTESPLIQRLKYLIESSRRIRADARQRQMLAAMEVISHMLVMERDVQRNEWRQEFKTAIRRHLVEAISEPEMSFAVANKAASLLIHFFDDDLLVGVQMP